MDMTTNDDVSRLLDMENENTFGFIDFMDETNLDQFMELIRDETAEAPPFQFCDSFGCQHVTGCLAESQFVPVPDDLFDFNMTSLSQINPIPKGMNVVEVEETQGKEDSSATTTMTALTPPPPKRSKKPDRSRTLLSERERRGRMKEKLYALRSLVPDITKMDKASIIGDAIRYVQGLQTKANMLKAEVAGLESSLNQSHNHPGGSFQNAENSTFTIGPPAIKKILQMEVFHVDLREYYVRLVCRRGQGIASLLYKALASLEFKVHSSYLAAATENYTFTFTFYVNKFEVDLNLPKMKLWITRAFLDQGFDFVTLPLA